MRKGDTLGLACVTFAVLAAGCVADRALESVDGATGPSLDVVVDPGFVADIDDSVDVPELAEMPDDTRRWAPDRTETGSGGPDVCAEACAPCDVGGVFVDSVCLYDTDGDGHLPTVAGGGDCDDSDPETYPGAPEICDGKDNNCNGQDDEGIPPVLCGKGVCKHTATSCVSGTPVECDPFEGAGAEICNGLDSDCNGEVDDVLGGCECLEGEVQECGTNTGECLKGTQDCVGGKWTECNGTGPVPEVCDGKDNDCDGNADEGDPGGGAQCGSMVGECSSGVSICVGGELLCEGEVLPAAEVCDGKDNDCDGTVDDGLGTVGCGQGLCANVVDACFDGKVQACVPLPPPEGTCDAQPAYCKSTTYGEDACGNPCSKVGPEKCYTVHPACLDSDPGTPTDDTECTTPKGKYNCGLSCQPWPNTIGADCDNCILVYCAVASGMDWAQFKCDNLLAPPTE